MKSLLALLWQWAESSGSAAEQQGQAALLSVQLASEPSSPSTSPLDSPLADSTLSGSASGASAPAEPSLLAPVTALDPAWSTPATAAEATGASSTGSAEFQLLSQELDELGMVHRRYQQRLNGLPVEGAIAIEHWRNGVRESISGEWLHQPPAGLLNRPSLSEARALASAMNHVGASTYKWQLAEEEAFLQSETGNPNASFKPQGQLVYYAGASQLNARPPRLAYVFDIYAHEPQSRQLVYVDALSGRVLGVNQLLHEADAMTGFSKQQAIATQSLSSTSYRLRQATTMAAGITRTIETYNLKTKTIYGQAVDFGDGDDKWGWSDSYTTNTPKDAYALDAHFGAEKTYDFYYRTFGRNSIDNKGFALKSYVHYSRNYFNAFWDGSRMTYGDGSSSNGNLPLTSLDVCGHEITHGLTSFTANLNYSYESGALNEAFSDIFGTAIEAYARGRTGIGVNSTSWSWTLGEDFNYVIRDMANPKAKGDPDTYQGTNWYSGTSDNGGVHTNSGVLNYWFALLTEGSGAGVEHSTLNIDDNTDTNDKGYKFDVLGLGLDKAQAVAYRTLTTYLTKTSQYSDARTWSLQAAADLVSSGLLTAQDAGEVAYAWNAVGVGGGTSASYTPVLTGTSAANSLYGGHLADSIRGLGGNDWLTGNGGGDTFVLADAAMHYYTDSSAATITDFNAGAGDKLQLRSGQSYAYTSSSSSSSTTTTISLNNDVIAVLNGVNLGSGTIASGSTPGWVTWV